MDLKYLRHPKTQSKALNYAELVDIMSVDNLEHKTIFQTACLEYFSQFDVSNNSNPPILHQ